MPTFAGGRLDGSEVVYSFSAAAQALAVARAGLSHRSLGPRGGILWCAGAEVSEDHWRPTFDKVERQVGTFAKIIRRISGVETGATIGERAVAYAGANHLLPKVLRRVGNAEAARLFDIVGEVSVGEVAGVGVTAGDEPTSESLFILAAGLAQKKAPPRLDLGLAEAAPGVLKSLSLAFEDETPLSDTEIQTARRDLINAFRIAVCMQETLGPIFNKKVLGLWFGASFIKDFLTLGWVCLGTIIFARLRRSTDELLESVDIAGRANEAETLWHLTIYFRSLVSERPELEPNFGIPALRRLMRDSSSVSQMLEQVKEIGLSEIVLSPWSNWRSLAPKTRMPFGLSAMSVGAPKELRLAGF
jgi:hypothetical protein